MCGTRRRGRVVLLSNADVEPWTAAPPLRRDRVDDGPSIVKSVPRVRARMAIETIVVAVGSSDMNRVARLAEEAVEVAEPTGADVVVVHAFTESEYEETIDVLDFDRELDEVEPDEVARRHSPVVKVREALQAADVGFEIRGGVGDRAETVVGIAEAVDADLVYVGGERRSPTGKAVFGSTAQEILFTAPCPVTYVRDDTR